MFRNLIVGDVVTFENKYICRIIEIKNGAYRLVVLKGFKKGHTKVTRDPSTMIYSPEWQHL